MAYEYYCMDCGKMLQQETVLFDMQYLLTQNKDIHFQILKFRMTRKELLALLAKGTLAEAGYQDVTLSWAEVMSVIANSNNLNHQEIAALTQEDVKAYIDRTGITAAAFNKPKKSIANIFGDDEEEEEEEEETQEQTAYVTPPAILALEALDEANADKAFTQNTLREDFELLRRGFLNGASYRFQIKPEEEEDNEGKKILVGYNLHIVVGNVYLKPEKARVCSKCGTGVFPHAGTAKHQSIAFIGYRASGKTSAILALTHYAENHMMVDLSAFADAGPSIWSGCNTIPNVATVEVLDKNERLREDLALYSQGYAPEKTDITKRSDAYCATFRIKNKAQSKHYLLTLTDLPGELCKNDGTVDDETVRKNFPVAISCDAYIACFDTRYIDPLKGGIASWVMNVCKWTDTFQKMRADHFRVETYVPTMLLFTKCKDLEEPETVVQNYRAMLPLEQTYMLKNEKQRIASNGLYDFVRQQFNEFGQLNKAYHAMMRCSPFGYGAPCYANIHDAKKSGLPVPEVKLPTPKNVDILMRWILSVSGCIPTEGEYRRNPMDPGALRLNNFCISRPQLRTENPLAENDENESLARCVLFENPGYFDEKILVKHDTPWSQVLVRGEAKMRPNSNAR